MRLITAQSSSWRSWKDEDVEFIDITRSWGDGVFAPSVGLLKAIKQQQIEWADYRINFLVEMRSSFRNNKQRWLEVINKDKPVVIACACKHVVGKELLCHRMLLVDCFAKVCKQQNVSFEYLGELTSSSFKTHIK